jgi:hypothetical protein
MTSYLSDALVDVLLAPIRPHRVNKDGKGFSHVEAYEVRAHLNRLFGFARWSEEVLEQTMVFEDIGAPDDPNPRARGKWTVCYRSLVRLTICAEDGKELARYTEGATGDATNMPSRADAHDMALKTSASQALKRCASNLGDQFGLSLYNKGSLQPLVQRIVNREAAGAPVQVDAHITNLASETEGEPETPARENSTPPPSRAPRQAPVAEVEPPAEAPAGDVAPGVNATCTAPPVAMAGHDDPTASPAAVEPSQASTEDVPGGDDDREPMDLAVASLNAASLQSPRDALVTLGQVLQLAVLHRIRNEIVPGVVPVTTLGAQITARMRQASAAINAEKVSA